MLNIYDKLKKLEESNDISDIKEGIVEMLQEIESGVYIVIDAPFGADSNINIVQDNAGEVISIDFKGAVELADECMSGRIIKL